MEFHLRPYSMSDAANLAFRANDARVAANLTDGFPYPYTLRDAERFITATLQNGEERDCMRAITVDGVVVGGIGIIGKTGIHRRGAAIGYWLAAPYWGKGIMTRAVAEMCGHAFDTYDIVRIDAEVFAYNTGSRRVLEKNGFTLEGITRRSIYKNGRLHDGSLYALLREDRERHAY